MPIANNAISLNHIDFLPGHFTCIDGCLADYKQLAVFHYKGPTLGVSRVFRRIVYQDPHTGPRTAAIAVACMPTLRQRHREAFFGLADWPVKDIGGFVNAHLLVISRVILHPQFRGMGLSTLLIRDLIDKCPKRYVEASAVMGRFIPMFERAGMFRLSPIDAPGPAYFLLDKKHPRKPRLP